MGTQFLLEGRSRNILSTTIMKAFIAIFALVAAALGEPESDPQFMYAHHAAMPAHHTAGMVQYSSGAVVPDDTLSVKAAKVQHHNAKVFEYAKKPYMHYAAPMVYTNPMVPTVAAKPIVYTKPVVPAVHTYAAKPMVYT